MQTEYKEHTITLDEGTFLFVVTGPQFEDDKFPSAYGAMDLAKQQIDKRIATAQKQKATTLRMALPAINAAGEPITVRGINRTDGSVLGVPEARAVAFEFFPVAPWIVELLKERAALKGRVEAIDEQVRPFGLRRSTGYGGRVDPDQYEQRTAALEADFKRKTEAALAAAPKAGS